MLNSFRAFFFLSLAAAQAVFAEPYAYIGHVAGMTIDIFDLETNLITTLMTGSGPQFIAVTPDGTRAFVSNNGGATVTAIDTSTNTVIPAGAMIPTGAGPQYIVAHPNGSTVYVCNNSGSSVTAIDVQTFATTSIPTGGSPNFLLFSPDGSMGYVCNIMGNDVTAFATATNMVTATIPMGGGSAPRSLAIAPDGSKLYVTNSGTPSVGVVNLSDNSVTFITTNIGTSPQGIAISFDGSLVVVGNTGSNSISVIDTATATAAPPFALGATPFNILFTPDDSKAVITMSNAAFLSIYDTASNMLSPTIATTGPTFFSTLSTDGSQMFIPAFGGALNILDISTMTITPHGPIGAFALSVAMRPFVNCALPPYNLRGTAGLEKFLFYTDRLNILTWTYPGFNLPDAFNIYRDASLQDLAGTVPGTGPYEFIDHNVRGGQTITYYVVSVCEGIESSPATVTIAR